MKATVIMFKKLLLSAICFSFIICGLPTHIKAEEVPVTASLVKELREKTGAGMMDCKKVLTETDGDMEKAIELLRERGIAKAAKK